MRDDADLEQRLRAARGDLEALSALALRHGHGLVCAIACHADDWQAVDRLQCRVWATARPALAEAGDLGPWLAAQARPLLGAHLEQAGHEAISARDTVRHLVVQTALEELRATGADITVFAGQVRDRLSALPPAERSLLDLRYRHELALATLASERGVGEPELAARLCAARALLDGHGGGEGPGGDRLMPALTEDWLAGTIDAPSRALLTASIGQDLTRAARFARQVRLHLLLKALLSPFDESQARAIARAATGRDSARLSVAHPPVARPRGHPSEATRTVHASRRPSGKRSRSPALAWALGGGALVLVALGVLALAPDRSRATAPPVVVDPAPARPPVEPAVASTPGPTRTPAPGASALRPVQLTPATASAPQIRPPAPEPAPPPSPRPAPTPAGGPLAITSVSLINADTEQPIRGFEALPDETTLRLSQLPTRHLNLRFNAPDAVMAASFSLPGCALRPAGIERGRPFSLSNDGDDYKAWTPAKGAYVLTVTPYADKEAKKPGAARSWRLRIED
jgi:hypothetical protein